MKRAQVNDMVGKRYEVNDNGDLNIYYIKIFETISARITTHFEREACSRGKTNKYFYHKRKWNKEVISNIKTGTKQIFAI